MLAKEKVLTITKSQTENILSQADTVPAEGWLRRIREAQGLSRRQIAEQLGVSVPAIQDYERSEAAGRITLTTLRKYAEVLDCEVVVNLVPKEKTGSTARPNPAGDSDTARSAVSPSRPAPQREIDTPETLFSDRMGLWSAPTHD